MIEVHISKTLIENNRKLGVNHPYIKVYNARTGESAWGHRVEFNGPATLTWRIRPDRERHVYLETMNTVFVVNEHEGGERKVEP